MNAGFLLILNIPPCPCGKGASDRKYPISKIYPIFKFKKFDLLFFILIFAFCIPCLANERVPLEPIVVSKKALFSKNAYTLRYQDITSLPVSSVPELLSYLGLDLQSRSLIGGIQTDFSLRGSTFQGVLILVNGRRINDPQTAHHNSDIPLTLEDIERIEIIPAAGSSVFGPDSMGGAINIITRKPKEQKTTIELTAGGHSTKAVLLSLSQRKGLFSGRLSLEDKESGGFQYDTEFKKFTLTSYLLYQTDSAELNLGLNYQEKEFGAYDFYTPHKGYPSQEWTKTYLLDFSLKLRQDNLLINPHFLWRRHFDKFLLDKTLNRTRYLNHHRTDLSTTGIYLETQTSFADRLGVGLEYGQEYINSTNLGKHNRKHQAFYIHTQKESVPFGFSVDTRLDDYSSFGLGLTGSFLLEGYLWANNKIYLGLGRASRIPSFTELYYSDPTTLGDERLSSEEALTYQVGFVSDNAKNMSLRVNFFFRQEEDVIDWIKQTPSQAKWQVRNITEAEVFGIENYIGYKKDNLDIRFNYTYINKRINDRGYLYKYGPNYIKHLITNIYILDLPFGVQEIEFLYKKKPVRRGWLLVNTCLKFNLKHLKSSYLFLKITNLLNVEYEEIEGIPQPGRWVEAGLRLQW
jgi:iron complex outermembrane receptor protein